jgi:NAD(P)H-dependent flavin oxidoreductase YrpB (nitropropane dioxygenase family)
MARSPSLETELCRTLGIDYPIFSVGFSMSAGPELAAAVSAAGGFGVLGGGSGGLILPDELRRRISRLREMTDRPFGLNLIIANEAEAALASDPAG